MMDIDMRDLTPRFLLEDRNGRALASAMGRAMQLAEAAVQAGLDCLLDVEKMPGWRLDEMAWEYSLLYDTGAELETRRAWVRDALLMQRIYGTPEAIVQYLRGLISEARVEEWWEYGAEPYHFRVRTGSLSALTEYKEKIAEVVQRAKNLRSVYDEVLIDHATPAFPAWAAVFVQTHRQTEIQMGGTP